eukprot:7831928-Prorocentrum_lima.AAC.1
MSSSVNLFRISFDVSPSSAVAIANCKGLQWLREEATIRDRCDVQKHAQGAGPERALCPRGFYLYLNIYQDL